MEGSWARRRILIWGKTRPELSKTYREIVCTGGVFADTRRLVRLYPIPLRYMDDERIFKKYQWIEAYVKKSPEDARPESYKIRYDGIETFDTIPTKSGNWNARAEWILRPGNILQSIEAMQRQQKVDHTSLGLIKPAYVAEVRAERIPQREKEKFQHNYEEAVRQMDLPLNPETGREVKPLRPSDFRFKIQFRCDDETCLREHSFGILDWETDALYFHLRQKGNSPDESAAKVVDKLQNEVCAPDKDLYFFLGNISTHPQIFTIVGLWWPKKRTATEQPRLF